MTQLLGVLLGAALAYWFGDRRQAADRKRRRASLATALLAELRTLEYSLSRSYYDVTIGFTNGRTPTDWFEEVGESFLLFSPKTVDATLRFRGFIRQMQRCRDECAQLPVEAIADYHHWKIRGLAGYSLQLIPELKTLLVEEGGTLPANPDVERVTFPALPTVPPTAFEWRLRGEPDSEDVPRAI